MSANEDVTRKHFSDYLASEIDPIILAKTDDWRELAVAAQVTGAELESAIELLPQESHETFRLLLGLYRADLEEQVSNLLAGIKIAPELPPRDSWLKYLWSQPIFERKDFLTVAAQFLRSKKLDDLAEEIQQMSAGEVARREYVEAISMKEREVKLTKVQTVALWEEKKREFLMYLSRKETKSWLLCVMAVLNGILGVAMVLVWMLWREPLVIFGMVVLLAVIYISKFSNWWPWTKFREYIVAKKYSENQEVFDGTDLGFDEEDFERGEG